MYMSGKDLHISIKLSDESELDFMFYYDQKTHKYEISIDYGCVYLDVTKKEAEAIYKFLSVLKEYLESR